MFPRDERIATHRQEAFELRGATFDQLRRTDQVMTIGAAFIATITTVAITRKELILGVPSAVFLLTAFVTQAYTHVVLTTSRGKTFDDKTAARR